MLLLLCFCCRKRLRSVGKLYNSRFEIVNNKLKSFCLFSSNELDFSEQTNVLRFFYLSFPFDLHRSRKPLRCQIQTQGLILNRQWPPEQIMERMRPKGHESLPDHGTIYAGMFGTPKQKRPGCFFYAQSFGTFTAMNLMVHHRSMVKAACLTGCRFSIRTIFDRGLYYRDNKMW